MEDNGGKMGKGHQRACMKDPWTKSMGWVGLNVEGRGGEGRGE